MAETEFSRFLLAVNYPPSDPHIRDSVEPPKELFMIRNESNLGFARACNQGFDASTGDVILFLNSDTIVPRAGLIRLLEALTSSGSIAAAGPYTNYSGHLQQIAPTYTSLDTLDLFADDFATSPLSTLNSQPVLDVDMLTGFCLAVKRSVLNELAEPQDSGHSTLNPQLSTVFDPRFTLGTFEDNDLCYRIRRAGYRLVIATKSYIHHHGSRTLGRISEDRKNQANGGISIRELMRRNEQLYREKWSEDLQSGYASHLSGLSTERIIFDPAKHPDVRRAHIAELARRAGISLCMIVKNEERCLADCLKSAKPFFKEIIVVDTGSADRTVEIAESFGAKVIHFPWTDSFSEARNESIRHATGKWIFWLDADDILPFSTGEAILNAALSSDAARGNEEMRKRGNGRGPSISQFPRMSPFPAGFVVPVQFTDDGSGGGVKVDHVKLFRNLPGVRFTLRIHEQIIWSLVPHGSIVRLENAVVMHTNYDNTPVGQERKRKRDYRLLKLDLKENPNHPFVLFNWGMTELSLRKYSAGARWLRKCIRFTPATDSHLRKAYALLAQALEGMSRPADALQAVMDGLAAVGDDPELHFHAGRLLSAQVQSAASPPNPLKGENLESGNSAQESSPLRGLGGDVHATLNLAKDHYLQTLASDLDGHYSSLDRGILGYKLFHNLGTVCMDLDQYREARDWWLKALDAAPNHLMSAFSLFDAALETGDFRTTRRMGLHVLQVEGPGENWAKMAVRNTEALGEDPEEFLHRAIDQFPEGHGPREVLCQRLLDTGRDYEAHPHLVWLQQRGSAKAAFFLGICATRRQDVTEALTWMERALALNPGHKETEAQVTALRAALVSPDVTSLELDQALAQIAADTGLDAKLLQKFAREDGVGGFGAENGAPQWPGGSVWDVDGRALYALVRALKPNTIVEVGSLVGCSTSHLALACKKNGRGEVYAVDPAADLSRVDPTLRKHIKPVLEDVFTWEPPETVDLLFEDGAHEPGFTSGVFDKLRPRLKPGALAICHDYFQRKHGPHVAEEFDQAFGEAAHSVLIQPSNCGLGYAVVQ